MAAVVSLLAIIILALDGAEPSELSACDRVVFMFDGHDEDQVQSARSQWKRLKCEGHMLSYWQQNHDGRWEKKASAAACVEP